MKAMFKDAWEQQEAILRGTAKTLKKQIDEIDRQIAGLLDRIVDAKSPSVITVYEGRIADKNRPSPPNSPGPRFFSACLIFSIWRAWSCKQLSKLADSIFSSGFFCILLSDLNRRLANRPCF